MITDRIELDDWAGNKHTFTFNPVDEDRLMVDLEDVVYEIEHTLGVMDYYGPGNDVSYYTGYSTDTEDLEDFNEIVRLLTQALKEKGYA